MGVSGQDAIIVSVSKWLGCWLQVFAMFGMDLGSQLRLPISWMRHSRLVNFNFCFVSSFDWGHSRRRPKDRLMRSDLVSINHPGLEQNYVTYTCSEMEDCRCSFVDPVRKINTKHPDFRCGQSYLHSFEIMAMSGLA